MTRLCLNRTNFEGCHAALPDDVDHCPKCQRTIDRQQLPLDEGSLIRSYRVRRMLGMGMTGAVYLVEDTERSEENSFVLKETALTAGISGAYEEFQLLQKSANPNLPQLFDMFEQDGYGFVVMEYVAAPHLEGLLKERGRILEKVVRNYALQLLSLLERLHSAEPPIVHGDIKPENLRVTDTGLLRLVDLSLFRSTDPQPTPTARDSRYQAPEYRRSGQLRPQSDLYSVAATLYHLVTAFPPPRADLREVKDNLTAPVQLCEHLSTNMNTAILRGLELSPYYRWATATEFRDAMIGKRPPSIRRRKSGSAPSSSVATPPPADPPPPQSPPAQTVRIPQHVEVNPHILGLLPILVAIGIVTLACGGLRWLASAQSPAITPSERQLVLADDFSDRAPATTDRSTYYLSGELEHTIRNGSLRFFTLDDKGFAFNGFARITNQTITEPTLLVTVILDEAPDDMYGGILLQPARRDAEPYLFLVNGRREFIVGVATDFATFIGNEEHQALTGRRDRLRVEIRDGTMTFYANDSQITTIANADEVVGMFALMVTSFGRMQPSTISFDDLAIYSAE